jgi:uncharacterized membrane protein
MMRVQELHPAIVHFPIALVPLSVAADIMGTQGHEPRWAWMGRTLWKVAAGAAGLAAVSGLIAQEEAQVPDEAHPLLATHRTLNVAAGTVILSLAMGRGRRERATGAEIALGVLTMGILTYSAWLGGRMVYEHGVGVRPAGGIRTDHESDMAALGAGGSVRQMAADVAHGVRSAAEDMADGIIAPALRPSVARRA